MKETHQRFTGLAVCAAMLLIAPAGASAGELRAGRAAVKITPPKGMPMAGYYRVRLSEGTHDDLYAKALVFEKDGTTVAMVACDLVSIPRTFVESARGLIRQSTGIPAANVMISATHTHTGPEMGTRLTGVDQQTLSLAKSYHESLPGLIAESVKLAKAGLQPVKVRAGIGHEDSISFVRRFLMKNGTVGWNPGKNNPNIVRPMSAIDPGVPVVSIESEDAKPLAAYVNFANHLDTVGGTEFSADYPYTLAKVLGEARGPDMLTIFTIGTAGNINHINVKNPRPQKGHGEAARIGGILAGAVLKTLSNLDAAEPLAVNGLKVAGETVNVPAAAIKPGDVEKARAVVALYGTPKAPAFLEQVHAFKVLDLHRLQGKPIEAEVQVIALGDQIAWVALPGEVFVELGQAIKLASPFRYTIVVELANGSPGYIPDSRAYAQGNYEVVNTRFAQGGGELLVEAARKLLIGLQHQ